MPMQHFRPTQAYKLPTFLPPTLYLSSLHPPQPLMFLAVLLYLLLPLPPLSRSGFFNGMLKVFEPKVLNFSTLSRVILWILSKFRNAVLIRLPLSEFLNTLLCDLIALTLGLAIFLPMAQTLAVASSFFSGKAYPY